MITFDPVQIKLVAQDELREEQFRKAVEAEKYRLRHLPRTWWRRLLNVRIKIYVKGEK